MISLLTTRPPELPPDAVEAELWARYGLRGALTPLPGERDQNFRLRTEHATYVLKFHNAEEDRAVADAQDAALRWIAQRDPTLDVPRVVTPQAVPNGRIVRLLTWVDGDPLVTRMPIDVPMLTCLGRTLGRLNAALAGFEHPGGEQPLLWDTQRVLELTPMLSAIPDAPLVQLGREVLERMATTTLPAMPPLPWQVIHNDANPHNVLVGDGGVCGVLDFGDMVTAPRIQELAVAAAYHCGSRPLEAMSALVRAYHAVHGLRPDEVAQLPALVAARCVATLAIGSWRTQQLRTDPRYVLKNYATTAATLTQLWPQVDRIAEALCATLET